MTEPHCRRWRITERDGEPEDELPVLGCIVYADATYELRPVIYIELEVETFSWSPGWYYDSYHYWQYLDPDIGVVTAWKPSRANRHLIGSVHNDERQKRLSRLKVISGGR